MHATRRTVELLAATLDVLRECGYENLTVDKVVARAHASKRTVYRRWPTNSELVAAAYAHGPRQATLPPDTGTLRGDLLQLAEQIAHDADMYASSGLGILAAPGSCPQLRKNCSPRTSISTGGTRSWACCAAAQTEARFPRRRSARRSGTCSPATCPTAQ